MLSSLTPVSPASRDAARGRRGRRRRAPPGGLDSVASVVSMDSCSASCGSSLRRRDRAADPVGSLERGGIRARPSARPGPPRRLPARPYARPFGGAVQGLVEVAGGVYGPASAVRRRRCPVAIAAGHPPMGRHAVRLLPGIVMVSGAESQGDGDRVPQLRQQVVVAGVQDGHVVGHVGVDVLLTVEDRGFLQPLAEGDDAFASSGVARSAARPPRPAR